MTTAPQDSAWHRVLGLDDLAEGRVTSVTIGRKTIALTHYDGHYGALDGRCPHQGGPLGQGTIEKGWLRCPWHGFDYNPLTGEPPAGFSDCPVSYPVELRDDGVYVALPEPQPEPRTFSDIMVETMLNWGVTHVFGMVGHSNLGFADAMRRQERLGNLTYIGVRHEAAAAFAASAYAKLSGRPAACFSIAGPGATNLLTGLWDAKMDRAPVLALTGQVGAQVLGPGSFQEINLASAFQAVTAWSQTVHAGSRPAELMTLAIKNAILQRAVGHLILPNEVQDLPAPDGAQPASPAGRLATDPLPPATAPLDDAVDRLHQTTRPAIVVGYGARFAMDAIIALAERLNAPIFTTFKAKGLIADNHPLGCGVLGRSGTPIASWIMNEADLLLVFGASFSDHTGIAPYVPTIQIDSDPIVLGKVHPVDVLLQGDAALTAQAMLDRCDGVDTVDQRPEIAERWALWRAEKASRAADDRGRGVAAAALFDSLNRLVPSDAVIAVDVGNNTYSFGRYLECAGQDVLMSGYLGSIGFALPAAMGAWAAAPQRPILAIAGDGGFAQYLAELTTVVKYDMPIKLILINNGELGKISTEQRAEERDVWQTSLHNPDFAAYAELCGAFGVRVDNAAALDDAISAALQHPGPALVEVLSDPQLV